jgi:pSer/pThr/pTyr-binding forkhead associated (FHA) protein
MPRLIVEVTASGGRTGAFAFGHSPVSIGSGALNDLVLDFPFVSQCHALVHFDERDHSRVRFVDLASRNGSLIAGEPTPANQPAPVTPKTDVLIGPLRLRMRVAEEAAAPEDGGEPDDDAERAYFGPMEEPRRQGDAGGVPPETTTLPAGFSAESFLASLQPGAPPLSEPTAPPRALTTHLTAVLSRLPAPPPATLGSPAAAPDPLSPFGHTKIVPRGWQASPEAPSGYAALAGFTRHLGRPEPAAAAAPSRPVPAETLQARLGSLAAALPSEDDRRLLVAIVGLAEFAAETFVTLRNTRELAGDELGLRVVQEATPVHRAATSEALLDHLLGDPREAPARLRQLTRATSELLVVHDLAFLAALREGVSALVERLDPQGPGFKARRRGLGVFGLREYQTYFEEETENPWREVLGRRFATSYAAVTCSQPIADAEPPSPPVLLSTPRPPQRAGTPAAVPLARVVFLSGPLEGRELGLPEGQVTFGRAEDNVIILDDPSVSRHHAVLTRRDEGWVVADAGSKNGLQVNGRAASSAVLEDGDTVEIGDVTLRFRIGPSV